MKLIKRNQLKKYQQGGLVGPKLLTMFQALVDRGVPNQAAFEIAWQSNKEVPKGYYSFGTRKPDVNSWADNVVYHQLQRRIYSGARDSTNFQEYRNATKAYNRLPTYTKWLLQGRSGGKNYINRYIEENNLGKPIAQINNQEDGFTNYFG